LTLFGLIDQTTLGKLEVDLASKESCCSLIFKNHSQSQPSMSFTIKHQNGRQRTAIIKTSHGTIQTPCFVPVATQAAAKALTTAQLSEISSQALMVNAYHAFLRPGLEVINKFDGLHNFMGWQKPIMTDSGGFQIFSLGKQNSAKIQGNKITFKSPYDATLQEFTPEKSIQIQEQLGADIIFAFDECIDFNSTLDVVQKSTERTHMWAQESLAAHSRKDQLLYGIVQGGRFKESREHSSEFIGKLGFEGFGIGSLFGEPKEESKNVIKWAMSNLPKDKPVHMLGIGQVDDIFYAVEQGGDTFDCVLATRLARMGYVFSSDCTSRTKWRYRITNSQFRLDKKPFDTNCSCWACTNHTRAYLYHLFKSNELLAYTLASYHNVAFFHNLMKQIREAIEQNNLEQLKKKWQASL